MIGLAAVCLVLLSSPGPVPAVVSLKSPGAQTAIKLEPPREIGRQEFLFASIVSVCEDDVSNFYVLDQQERKVFKFSPDGRLLKSFGRKGQGPGDFQSPGLISFTPAGELAVLEDIGAISFHKTDGAFVRRLDLNGRLGVGFVGPDRYYAWEWQPRSQVQLMVDGKNSVIKTFHSLAIDLFSTQLPDETGRLVMFNYGHDSYVPRFLYSYNHGLSAIGISDRYEIDLVDEKGKGAGVVRRNVPPRKFSGKEREYLERELRDFAASKNWPKNVVRELSRKIPTGKTLIGAVRVSPNRIFVFRQAVDISAEPLLFPVDIFSRSGEFLGTTELAETPVFISAGAMYFVRADADGNVYLVRRAYSCRL